MARNDSLFDPDEPGSAPHQDDYATPETETVTIVPPEGKYQETAVSLLEAAGDRPQDVQALDGNFVVTKAVADKAKVAEAKVQRAPQTGSASVPSGNGPDTTTATTKTAAKAPAKAASRSTSASK